jgi:ferredoxin
MEGKRLRILALSGTGNSRLVAEAIAERAGTRGAAVEVVPWERALQPAADGATLVLCLPTHGFAAPWGVFGTLMRLRPGRGAHAAVVATRGASRLGPLWIQGFEGSAAMLPALLLAARGYRVRAFMGIDMPANWYAVHPPMSAASAAVVYGRARERAAELADSLVAGGMLLRPAALLSGIIGLALLPVSAAYMFVGRPMLSRLFFADRRCNGCGTCAASCPFAAIRMGRGGAPVWTMRCESCMRCIAYCPAGAVQVQLPWAVGIVAAASAVTRAARPLLAPLAPLGALAHPLLTVALAAAAYPLLALLARLPGVGRLLAVTSPSRWFRRPQLPLPLPRLRQ